MYLEFQANPDMEEEFFVAAQLHMTVARLRAEMSNDEYVRWLVYFGRKGQRGQIAGPL